MKWKILLTLMGSFAVAAVFLLSGREQPSEKPFDVAADAKSVRMNEARRLSSEPLENIQSGADKKPVLPVTKLPTMAPAVAEREPEHAFADPQTEDAERGADPRAIQRRDDEEEQLRQIRNKTPILKNN